MPEEAEVTFETVYRAMRIAERQAHEFAGSQPWSGRGGKHESKKQEAHRLSMIIRRNQQAAAFSEWLDKEAGL